MDRGDFPLEISANGDAVPAVEWLTLRECANPFPEDSRLVGLLRTPPNWPVLLTLADDHGLLPLLSARVKTIDPALVPGKPGRCGLPENLYSSRPRDRHDRLRSRTLRQAFRPTGNMGP